MGCKKKRLLITENATVQKMEMAGMSSINFEIVPENKEYGYLWPRARVTRAEEKEREKKKGKNKS